MTAGRHVSDASRPNQTDRSSEALLRIIVARGWPGRQSLLPIGINKDSSFSYCLKEHNRERAESESPFAPWGRALEIGPPAEGALTLTRPGSPQLDRDRLDRHPPRIALWRLPSPYCNDLLVLRHLCRALQEKPRGKEWTTKAERQRVPPNITPSGS